MVDAGAEDETTRGEMKKSQDGEMVSKSNPKSMRVETYWYVRPVRGEPGEGKIMRGSGRVLCDQGTKQDRPLKQRKSKQEGDLPSPG